jgi:hypothetical protein
VASILTLLNVILAKLFKNNNRALNIPVIGDVVYYPL